MSSYEVHACTDVTGFGLLGHASEMAKGSGNGLTIRRDDVPVLPRARELAEEGFVPGERATTSLIWKAQSSIPNHWIRSAVICYAMP